MSEFSGTTYDPKLTVVTSTIIPPSTNQPTCTIYPNQNLTLIKQNKTNNTIIFPETSLPVIILNKGGVVAI
jgi:hypothetical protein